MSERKQAPPYGALLYREWPGPNRTLYITCGEHAWDPARRWKAARDAGGHLGRSFVCLPPDTHPDDYDWGFARGASCLAFDFGGFDLWDELATCVFLAGATEFVAVRGHLTKFPLVQRWEVQWTDDEGRAA